MATSTQSLWSWWTITHSLCKVHVIFLSFVVCGRADVWRTEPDEKNWAKERSAANVQASSFVLTGRQCHTSMILQASMMSTHMAPCLFLPHKWATQIKSKFTIATRFNSSSVKNTELNSETAPHGRAPRELLIELNNTLMTSTLETQGESFFSYIECTALTHEKNHLHVNGYLHYSCSEVWSTDISPMLLYHLYT